MGPLFVCLSVLSITLVYCGQTIGWIKMKLGMEVGLGLARPRPGHIVLDGDPAPPPQKGAQQYCAPFLVLCPLFEEGELGLHL